MSKSPSLTSAELIKRSDALRQQAEELKRKEIPGVVARMKEAIAEAFPAKPTETFIKYRDANGHAWSGFGPKPKWFKEALASGVDESALKV